MKMDKRINKDPELYAGMYCKQFDKQFDKFKNVAVFFEFAVKLIRI